MSLNNEDECTNEPESEPGEVDKEDEDKALS